MSCDRPRLDHRSGRGTGAGLRAAARAERRGTGPGLALPHHRAPAPLHRGARRAAAHPVGFIRASRPVRSRFDRPPDRQAVRSRLAAGVQSVAFRGSRDLRGHRGGRVGADVERLRPIDDADSLVERYFAPDERRQYQAIETAGAEWRRSTASGPARKHSSKPPAPASTASCSRSRSRSLREARPTAPDVAVDPAGRWTLRCVRAARAATSRPSRSIATSTRSSWSTGRRAPGDDRVEAPLPS